MLVGAAQLSLRNSLLTVPSQVYQTECIYNLASDHRRKGVYNQDIDGLQTKTSTLTTLIEAILNYPQKDVHELVRQIRNCESLDHVAESINSQISAEDAPMNLSEKPCEFEQTSSFESHLSSKLGQLRLDNKGGARFYGGTSNLLFIDDGVEPPSPTEQSSTSDGIDATMSDPVTSWTSVTDDSNLILHLLNMYFTWHYSFFVTLSRRAFSNHFAMGNFKGSVRRRLDYCTPLLVNTM